MNLKVSDFAAACIISVIILFLASIMSANLHDNKPFWLGTFGVVLLINIIFYIRGNHDKKKK